MQLHQGCPSNKNLTAPPPDLMSWAEKITLGINPNKATIQDNGNILIDAKFWNSLDGDAKQLLLLHELAHNQKSGCAHHCDGKPQGCERCADNRMGACAAQLGFTESRMLDSVKSLAVKSRSTILRDAKAGFLATIATKAIPTTSKQLGGSVMAPPLPNNAAPNVPGTTIAAPATPTLPAPSSPTTNDIIAIPSVGEIENDDFKCPNYEWLIGIVGLTLTASIVATIIWGEK